ncbi:MAG: hypothetical protein K0R38_2579 [Polyangiaceae bacterium]|nr:hypothetical protein [Polyangiaceae bacterium]
MAPRAVDEQALHELVAAGDSKPPEDHADLIGDGARRRAARPRDIQVAIAFDEAPEDGQHFGEWSRLGLLQLEAGRLFIADVDGLRKVAQLSED